MCTCINTVCTVHVGLPFNAQSLKPVKSHTTGNYASIPPPTSDEPSVVKEDEQSFDEVSRKF